MSSQNGMDFNGYFSQEYAGVYAPYGLVYGGMLLREIPGSSSMGGGLIDAISIYPFSKSSDILQQSKAAAELNAVSATLISDPLDFDSLPQQVGDHQLQSQWYKRHNICDLLKYDEKALPENHRRNIKESYKKGYVAMNMLPNVIGTAAMVHNVYQNLVSRHSIPDKWFTNYSQQQFEGLLSTPGAVLFQYNSDDGPEGVSLFYFNGDNVYYHLSAQTDRGYNCRSMFGMMHTALLFFKRLGAKHCLIGSVPEGGSEGLERFKAGFSHRWITNQIFKLILDKEKYQQLSAEKPPSDFFPLYRS